MLLLLCVSLAFDRPRRYRGQGLRNIRLCLLMMPGGWRLCGLIKLLLLLIIALVCILQLAVVSVEPARKTGPLLPTYRNLPRVRLLNNHRQLTVRQS